VTIFEMAATDSTREVALYRHAYNQGESNIIEKGSPAGWVRGGTIDSLNLPPIDLCKMDIEGAELMALQGMEATLKRSPGIVLMAEYAQHLGAGEALVDCLKSRFASVDVIEQELVKAPGEIPPFCNLVARRRTDAQG